MYIVDNSKIGKYLKALIGEKYQSNRQFCQDYLRVSTGDFLDHDISNMANRLSQILKGTKGIQIYDLPIFSQLLDASCEEIISGGQSFARVNNRTTNYSIAFSRDKEDWEQYANREDKLILNPDEYGNTVIDYGLKFKNYDFLKFLMEKEYIWFVSGNDKDYISSFAPGTSIERRKLEDQDYALPVKMREDGTLRANMICLAIENEDLEMLEKLHAREVPQMYMAHPMRNIQLDTKEQYDEKLIKHIACASDSIIDYFTDTFEIRDSVKYKDGVERSYKYVFPFMSQLIDELIKSKHPLTEIVLKKAIDHNKWTYDSFNELIEESIQVAKDYYGFDRYTYLEEDKKQIMVSVMEYFNFIEKDKLVSFLNYFGRNGIITNILYITSKPKEVKDKYLVDEVNDCYNKIIELKTRGGS